MGKDECVFFEETNPKNEDNSEEPKKKLSASV